MYLTIPLSLDRICLVGLQPDEAALLELAFVDYMIHFCVVFSIALSLVIDPQIGAYVRVESMLWTKLLISLKTTLKRSGAPCCPASGLTWTHCSTGCEKAGLGSSPELNILL